MALFDVIGELYDPNADVKPRFLVNQGGTSSGKTYTIMQRLIVLSFEHPMAIITVCGQDLPNLKVGAMRDLDTILHTRAELLDWFKNNKSDSSYRGKNGSIIEFKSYQDAQDAKNGKRDYLFVNEANGVPYDVFWQLQIRTRKQVIIDYNPTARFWVHDKIIGREDCKLIISDHRNNRFLTEDEHQKIEEIEDKESHSGGDSKLVADYISYLETGKRPLGISELADSIQSHRLAFGAEEKRLEHPLPKISETMACEKSVKNESSGGIYSAVSEFIGKNAENAVKTISMTVNCRKEDLKEKLESDMAFISSLIGSKAYKCDKITSEKGYPHGFIVTYFENGAIARYSFTCSPLKNRTEISVFAPSANVYADSEKGEVITKTTDLFGRDEKTEAKGKSVFGGKISDYLIKNEISDII